MIIVEGYPVGGILFLLYIIQDEKFQIVRCKEIVNANLQREWRISIGRVYFFEGRKNLFVQ